MFACFLGQEIRWGQVQRHLHGAEHREGQGGAGPGPTAGPAAAGPRGPG